MSKSLAWSKCHKEQRKRKQSRSDMWNQDITILSPIDITTPKRLHTLLKWLGLDSHGNKDGKITIISLHLG